MMKWGIAFHYSVFLVFYSIFLIELSGRKQELIEILLFFHLQLILLNNRIQSFNKSKDLFTACKFYSR